MPTPTVRRLQLGNELRHLREEAGCSADEAAKVIERTDSTISRLELGQTGLRQRDLRDLVRYYASKLDATVDETWYLELAKGSEQRGRWTGYRSVFAKHFRMAVDLERDASEINQYHVEIIPGLLQTREYMHALMADAQARVVDQSIEDAVRARLERQEVLTRADNPEFRFVLAESSIRRVMGSPDVMQAQLARLAEVAQRPNVQLQILPFDARTVAVVGYMFTYFRVPSPGRSLPLEFFYVEDYTDARYIDDPTEVEKYRGLWQRLLGAALDPVESRELLLRVAETYT